MRSAVRVPVGSPEDMAAACIYLASRGGAYVNGCLLVVDGGMVATAARL
jgi:NAD(P)-dependent dehydrogenase (short-subunit alcohol dehydrogenase family)